MGMLFIMYWNGKVDKTLGLKAAKNTHYMKKNFR